MGITDVKCIKKIEPKTASFLKAAGPAGLIVRRDKGTGDPVFYLWQAWTLVRLDKETAAALAREICRRIPNACPTTQNGAYRRPRRSIGGNCSTRAYRRPIRQIRP